MLSLIFVLRLNTNGVHTIYLQIGQRDIGEDR